jgi:hypothetical protein
VAGPRVVRAKQVIGGASPAASILLIEVPFQRSDRVVLDNRARARFKY